MDILQNIKVPTGNILVVSGDIGKLELISVGDYGKDVNMKADFLGLSREPSPIRHTDIMPLTKKWVITVSTQYGCAMGCNFCDVPLVGNGENCTENDIVNQVKTAMSLHPEITHTDRLNIHFARMGEPTWNFNLLKAMTRICDDIVGFNIHPVISTMMPKNNKELSLFMCWWMDVKNIIFKGNAGLQLSINSTSEAERNIMFNNNCLPLNGIHKIMKDLIPKGRKIALNFAMADYEIDPQILLKYFDPKYYICKLTPMHKTSTALKNDIKTKGDYTSYYSYKYYERALLRAGYDVIVFIASKEEDLSRITCGNAILSGKYS